MTMQAKAALLFSVLPLAVAHLGYPIDTSIPAYSTAFGGSYCTGPYPGGYLSDPNSSHPFYFGVDCYVTDGQPAITLGAWFAAVLFSGCFIYLVVVIRKEVGYSSFLRDVSMYFFWLAMSWWGGSMLHSMAYVGSQYKNVADVPGWVYSLGTGFWFVEYLSANADGFMKLLIGLRLIFEPCCRCSTEKLWTFLNGVLYFYIIPTDAFGHYFYGTCIVPFGLYEYLFNYAGEVSIIVYGVLKCDFLLFVSGLIETAYYALPIPESLLSWRWFNDASYADCSEIFGWILFFIGILKILRKNSAKLQTESKTEPLLM